MNTRIRHLCLYALFCLPLVAAAGPVAYSWVDGDGVTHFSDVAPTGTTVQGNVVTVPVAEDFTVPDPAGDYYSIANQWKRAQQERTEKDRLALEREQLRIDWYRAEQEAGRAEVQARTEANPAPVIIVRDAYPRWKPGRHGQRTFHPWSGKQYTKQSFFEHAQRTAPIRHAVGPVTTARQPDDGKPERGLLNTPGLAGSEHTSRNSLAD